MAEISGSKAKVELELSLDQKSARKTIENYEKLAAKDQERLRVAELSKGAKQKRQQFLKDLKLQQKYELQFHKKGLDRKSAVEKARLRVAMSERERLETDHAEKMSEVQKKKSGAGNSAFAGTFMGSFLGNIAASIAKAGGDMIQNAFKNLEKAETQNFFSQSFGGKAMNELRRATVRTGEPIENLVETFSQLSNIVGKNRSQGLIRSMTDLSNPLYRLSEVANDFSNFLKGGALDETGDFGGNFGKGKARQANMLLQQQQMLVESGLAYSLSDDNLIQQREKFLGTLKTKNSYTASQATQLKRGAAAGYENLQIDLADKVVKPIVSGLGGDGISPEAIAGMSLSADGAKIALSSLNGVVKETVNSLKDFTSNVKDAALSFLGFGDGKDKHLEAR